MTTEQQLKHIDYKLRVINSYMATADKNSQFCDACMIAKIALLDLKKLIKEK